MITILADITDSNIFKNYWVPLICKHREVEFIFGKTKNVKRPKMADWSNVKFAAEKDSSRLVKFASNKFIYMTVQNEIPTYELMVNLRNPKEGTQTNEANVYEDGRNWQPGIKRSWL